MVAGGLCAILALRRKSRTWKLSRICLSGVLEIGSVLEPVMLQKQNAAVREISGKVVCRRVCKRVLLTEGRMEDAICM